MSNVAIILTVDVSLCLMAVVVYALSFCNIIKLHRNVIRKRTKWQIIHKASRHEKQYQINSWCTVNTSWRMVCAPSLPHCKMVYDATGLAEISPVLFG
jgi:hypothetical protein